MADAPASIRNFRRNSAMWDLLAKDVRYHQTLRAGIIWIRQNRYEMGYGMELRHLRQFVAVAEEGHITRAAERLGLQQPPLSQRIRAIEEELGVQLFRRKPRGVELTDAGRVFLERARATLANYDGAFEATRSAARGEQGRLCIGIQPTTLFHPFVPSVIRAFRTTYPHVSLTLDECLRADAIERMRNQ